MHGRVSFIKLLLGVFGGKKKKENKRGEVLEEVRVSQFIKNSLGGKKGKKNNAGAAGHRPPFRSKLIEEHLEKKRKRRRKIAGRPGSACCSFSRKKEEEKKGEKGGEEGIGAAREAAPSTVIQKGGFAYTRR